MTKILNECWILFMYYKCWQRNWYILIRLVPEFELGPAKLGTSGEVLFNSQWFNIEPTEFYVKGTALGTRCVQEVKQTKIPRVYIRVGGDGQ